MASPLEKQRNKLLQELKRGTDLESELEAAIRDLEELAK